MDPISILKGLKDKVLDAQNFDILKHVYDLQNENLEQLKHNNDALKEGNDLLKEKVDLLRKENESLKQRVEELNRKLSQIDDGNMSLRFSEVANAILELYRQRDSTDLWKSSDIIPALNFRAIQVESAIDELEKADMIDLVSMSYEGNIRYMLTDKGKKYLAGNT